MAFLTTETKPVRSKPAAAAPFKARKSSQTKGSFRDAQKYARNKSFEKKAKTHKLKLSELAIFTQQLASMLGAGLPLVSSLEALQEQTENPVFRIIIREVRNDISTGTSLSEATRKFPNAFNQLFVSMVEAGEASGGLAEILKEVSSYFESSVKLMKKVKSAMTYPIAVIGLSVILVNVLLIFVIPVFADMFSDFGADLPAPTQALIDLSDWLKGNILYVIIAGIAAWKLWGKFVKTPKGREVRDSLLLRMPIFGKLILKITLSRFCRTYATLMASGVPILRSLEIVSASSNMVPVERACAAISKRVTEGGQVSDVLQEDTFFPPMMKHMVKAGERVGNVDGMMNKISDFYDTEAEAIIASLTSLIEPMLIVFLGVFVGGIVMAMFLPIFQLSSVAGG